MPFWFESRPPTPDPWSGRQPRYEKLIAERSGRFVLTTRLPSGQPIRVPLGRPEQPRRDR